MTQAAGRCVAHFADTLREAAQKQKIPLTGFSPMTGSLIPNFDCSYKDIRTAPRHELLAVQQHGKQRRVSRARRIMRGIILSCRAGVNFVSYGDI